MIGYSGKRVFLSDEIDATVAQNNRNQRQIFKWCRQYTLVSPQQQNAWMNKIETDKSIKMYSIRGGSQPLDKQLGVCGFTSIDKHNQSAEFSLYINTENQSLGFGKDALYTLLRHGFEDHNFNRIWGEVFDGNPALQKFLKIGMKVEGIQRETYFREGKFIDSVIVSMLRKEWTP